MLKRFFHESESQYTPVFISRIVQLYGNDILIGGDPGYGDDFEKAMRAVDACKAKKHVYLVGPGMEEWSAEEAAEIKENARSVDIDTDDPRWKKEWYTSGWIRKCEEWFVQYNSLGYYSAEIDNIDAALKNDPPSLIKFYTHMHEFFERNKIQTKLMMKNLSISELQAVKEHPKLHNMFAEFGMFENGSGNSKKQIELAASMGIQAVTPVNGLRDTNHYGTVREGIPFSVR